MHMYIHMHTYMMRYFCLLQRSSKSVLIVLSDHLKFSPTHLGVHLTSLATYPTVAVGHVHWAVLPCHDDDDENTYVCIYIYIYIYMCIYTYI
jgi:hypothetical protein